MKLLNLSLGVGNRELVSSHLFLFDRSLLNGSRAISSKLVCFPKQLLMRL